MIAYDASAATSLWALSAGNDMMYVGVDATGVCRPAFAGHGIILTRGPHLMSGYWSEGGLDLFQRPDFWFETGDIGETLTIW